MTEKERLNVTVDPDIKRELQARDDINVSGLANSLFKQYLKGETKDKAADQIRANRLREDAQELVEEAESLKRQAQQIEERHEQERQEREETWKTAVNTITPPDVKLNSYDMDNWRPDPDEQAVSLWADKIGITEAEFCERYPDKRERYAEQEPRDKTYQ